MPSFIAACITPASLHDREILAKTPYVARFLTRSEKPSRRLWLETPQSFRPDALVEQAPSASWEATTHKGPDSDEYYVRTPTFADGKVLSCPIRDTTLCIPVTTVQQYDGTTREFLQNLPILAAKKHLQTLRDYYESLE